MKTLRIAAGVALVAYHCVCYSQPDVPCGQPLEAALRSGAVLTIDSRSAGIEIVATENETIHVTCKANDKDSDTESVTHTRLQLSGTPTHAVLRITGPHLANGNLQIRVEVPRKVNLGIQMPAGQVTVKDVVGDKDIELHAGQISISSNRTWDYKDVDVSVSIGQVSAPVYGADKGGFFRELRKHNKDGEYRLRAHVTTGQIELLGRSASPDADPQ